MGVSVLWRVKRTSKDQLYRKVWGKASDQRGRRSDRMGTCGRWIVEKSIG